VSARPTFSETALRAAGFAGFVTVAELRDEHCARIPLRPGVYVILRVDETAPRFLRTSPAGWFKGEDPTEALSVLRARWVPGTPLLYVGKATAGIRNSRHLRKRLTELLDFGAGRPIGHRGGRYLWQIEGADRFLVAWHPDEDPTGAENELLLAFVAAYGSYPFANIAGPRG
jgi:hypothetical protein